MLADPGGELLGVIFLLVGGHAIEYKRWEK
jgi:hypothetical protein